ncbi:MAG: dephospho-CoA kinase [Spirochaetaceae bacterium]|jgi:dephospho-CoA kinase|nr:dephospho-CoA kinase [Spirochaetaceae bacterium]
MNKNKSAVIGVVGPMCAGKSLASRMLEEMGCAAIDADTVAHRAVETAKEDILAHFSAEAEKRGISLLTGDGKIDRRALGAIVFSGKALLKEHESIVYPHIEAELNRFIDSNRDRCTVLNAAVLYKTDIIYRCDFILYIDSPMLLRFFRALKRKNLSVIQILQRFYAQKDIYTQHCKKNVDIYKVYNWGQAANLREQLKSVLEMKGY